MQIICETCLKPFDSDKTRQFCSVTCRARSPRFREQMLANLEKARAAYVPPARKGENRPCVHCGEPVYMTQTMIKRGARFCSREHYRLWMADRFDRNIGAVNLITAMNNYDEFLSQDKLTCLIPGCAWTGDDLSLHMNLTHGITAADLKEKAGFNNSTGVVSAPMARHLEARGNKGCTHVLSAVRPNRKGTTQEIRNEAREHINKAAAVRSVASTFTNKKGTA